MSYVEHLFMFVSHLLWLLWRNVCLGLFPTFWSGCLFFWYWVVWAACIFWKLVLCQLFPLRLFSPILRVVFSPVCSFLCCTKSFKESPCHLSWWLYQFTFSPTGQECSLFSTPSPAFIVCRLFDDGHSDWCEVISHCGFDLHFSNNKPCWASFHVFLRYVYVFGEMSV